MVLNVRREDHNKPQDRQRPDPENLKNLIKNKTGDHKEEELMIDSRYLEICLQKRFTDDIHNYIDEGDQEWLGWNWRKFRIGVQVSSFNKNQLTKQDAFLEMINEDFEFFPSL